MATNETNRPAEDEPTTAAAERTPPQAAPQDAELDDASLDSVAGGCIIPPILIIDRLRGDPAP
jgi:hypothetical protein